MAKQLLGLGTVANDGTGDNLRQAGIKINANFDEIYSAIGDGTALYAIATEDYVDNAVSNAVTGVLDGAPTALDTLNELAAALNDDASYATTITNALADKANSADLATVATSGSYNDLTDTPTLFSGNYADLTGTPTLPTASSLSVDDLITLSGVAEGSADLGTFTGTTIADNSTVKTALQDLETAVEGKQASITTVLTLTASTAAPTVPAGTFAVADGVTWDPATKSGSVPYPVFYDGVSWTALF